MHWPRRADYTQAVRDYPDISIKDVKLKGGRPRYGKDGFLMSFAGGFSIVYPIEMVSQIYALRCWTQEVGNAEFRYKEISIYLKQVGLPCFVDFEYVPEGILINGEKYPITRMEWTKGETLRDFIEQNIQDAHIFKKVAFEFQKMVASLHKHQIAHGDLQDGNILLNRIGTDINIKLIDYDSLFVPTLKGQPEQIVGLSEYQHPKRMEGGGQVNEKVDYFSELVIYLSFLSLAENPSLWGEYGKEDRVNNGLLFSKKDFQNPNQSKIFNLLINLSPDIQQLTISLKNYCVKNTIDDLQPLERILPKHDAKYFTERGHIHINKSCYNEAISEFNKAISLDPNYKEALYGLGRTYLHSNRYDEAIDVCLQVTSIDSNYKEAYHVLALAYFKSNNNKKAISAINEVFRIDPNYFPARQLLDTIKSTKTKSTSRNNTPTYPSQNIDPQQNSRPPTQSTPGTRLNKFLLVLFPTVLMICIIILIYQAEDKNDVLSKFSELERQQTSQGTNLKQLTDDIETLKKEKGELSSENKELKSQLTEKETVIKGLNDRIQILEGINTPYQNDTSRMALIPAGVFQMGSGNPNDYSDERPVHRVYVDAFYIDKYEVTNMEYKAFIDANPRWRKVYISSSYHDGNYLMNWNGNNFPIGKGNHPVTYVSWYAAMAYAQWIDKRLPTEAEWEKAARGGILYMRYPTSNQIDLTDANYGLDVGDTTPVGSYSANRFGVLDIIGNVSEWCLDEYKSNYYSNSQYRNPVAGGSISKLTQEFNQQETNRVLRGGGWSSSGLRVRVSYRIFQKPTYTSAKIGFRCVKPTNQ